MDRGIAAEDLVLSPLTNQWESAAAMFEFSDYFESQGVYYPTRAILANFWWRLLAYVIDYIVVLLSLMMLLLGLGLILAYTGVNSSEHETATGDADTAGAYTVLRLLVLIVLIFYNAAFEATRLQGSIGKTICKLKVVNAAGEKLSFGIALGRNFAKILSSMVCGLGFFSVLWDKNRQAWHDHLAKTFIIRKQ
ncbi:MAG TPA: RDD family protein [Mucilaginibacter sp.]|jgi:uncharacterized RDD family membrane protein YckC|nr:RDD family protein [Mucilaginibacter sp.]